MFMFWFFGASMISFVSGVLSVLVALIPGATPVSFILAPLALITGVLGITFGGGKSLAVGGIITGGVAIFLSLILAFL
jgi:hypothetical protein